MDENWDNDKITEILGLEIENVHRIREEHQRLEFAKQLEITEEPAFIKDDLVTKCLLKDMYLKKGSLDGAENMLLLGLHAVGLKRFLKLSSEDTRVKLRNMLQEQD